MAQTIKLKRSATSGAVPTTGSLELGEVAINTYDGKMYIKKDDGTEAVVQIGDTSEYLPLAGGTLTGSLSGTSASFSSTLSGDSYFANDLAPTNSQPGANQAEFSGYGIIGNRSTFYITNTSSVQIGTGTTHNQNPATTFTDTNVNIHTGRGLQFNGTTVIDSSRNLTNIGTITATGGTLTGDLNFGDNDKAVFGAGSDLQIYHDGAHSRIAEVGTGDLTIRASSNLFLQSADNENYLKAVANGAATIYHNNVAKLATTSTGIDVTGTVTADAITSQGTLGNWSIDSQGAIQTFTRPSANYIKASNASGSLMLQTGGANNRLNIASNGSVTANVDLRAPTFYDSNNTSYYVNPASTSNVKGFIFNSGTTLTQSTPNIESLASNNTAGNVHYHATFCRNDGTVNGKITTNYYATTYATTSDYRVKEDIQPMGSATADLMALNPVNFQWVGSDIRTDGFLAHEVAAVVPDAVVGDKDAVDAGGNADLQGLDQSKLVPLLVKTIQELEARITALESA